MTRPPRFWSPLAVGFFFLASLLTIGCWRTPPAATDTKTIRTGPEDTFDPVREALARSGDVTACRTALQQFNTAVSSGSVPRPPAMTTEDKDRLQKAYGLDAGAVAELEGSVYTLLDGYHLETCLLLRDAARSLEVDGQPPAVRAATAFNWVVRQVALEETGEEPLPPLPVLRRGRGGVLERALVFVELLRQLNLDGCLVTVPADSKFRPWCAGAALSDGTRRGLLLFDLRLGIAVPGPDGSPATLQEVRAKPELLQALSADEKNRYDVTADQATHASVYATPSLSALAPRQRPLQDELLGSELGIRVAEEPFDLLKRLQTAGGSEEPVRSHAGLVGALRRYLPPEDGGMDPGVAVELQSLGGYVGPQDRHALRYPKPAVFALRLTPWWALPDPIRALPWNSELGRRPRAIFAQMFVPLFLDAGHPRDLVLRGRLGEATQDLVHELDDAKNHGERLQKAPPELLERMDEWIKRAKMVYGQQGRGEGDTTRGPVEVLWKEGLPILTVVLEGAASEPQALLLTYQLALSKHEQAERLQARVDRVQAAGKTATPADVAAARAAWENALSYWKTFATDFGLGANSHTRILEARCHEGLGDRAAAARALREDLSDQTPPLDRLSRLLRARRLGA